jgi:hypothetical protein
MKRQDVLLIAREHMMEFVHETSLVRFTDDVIRACCAELEANGYDDASEQLKKGLLE